MPRRHRLILAAGLGLAAACGGSPGEPPRREGPADAPTTSQPRSLDGWQESYASPLPPIAADDEELALARAAREAGARCADDDRLRVAARAHAAQLVEAGGIARDDTDLDRLRHHLSRLGAADYLVDSVFVPLDDGPSGAAALRAFVERRGDRWTHCGIGVAREGGRRAALWIGVRRMIELEPFPVRQPAGGQLIVSGRTTDPRIQRVQSYLGLPGGAVHALSPVEPGRHGHFAVGVRLEGAGRHELELMVDAGRGPEIAALLPLFVDVEPDRGPVVAPPDEGAPLAGEDLRQQLLQLLTAARKRSGTGPLEPDARLAAIADEHSREMVAGRFFGHVSPTRGGLESRLERAGLSPRLSAENIARSSGALRVHRNLLGSPGHRLTALDPRYTHVGIGFAWDGDELVVTEIFARW